MKRWYRKIAAMASLAVVGAVGLPAVSFAVPAYNPPGMDVGALPTPTVNGIMVPSIFGVTPNWNLSPSLEKFVDPLPGLGCAGVPGEKCIPVAVPDKLTYPGSDYYVIELQQYQEKMHRDLPPTTLRGYVQVNNGTNAAGTANDVAPGPIHYLGPIIVAQKDRPVRVKFVNKLAKVADGGNLFVPVDTTIMAAGKGPLKADGTPCTYELAVGTSTPFFELGNDCAMYPQNRAELHLHGGLSPWISDGTPHQWVTPAGEDTPYKQGVAMKNVPDMEDPGEGAITYYWTNQQSGRFLFYHDHAVGLTRLNVYVGEAAGYLIRDAVEQALIDNGIIPGTKTNGTVSMGGEIPLVIQDKNFVDPTTIGTLDPTWNWGTGTNVLPNGNKEPVGGDLWWPHVYMTAENPYDVGGVNPMGRWVYGLWFWPPTTGIPYQLEDNPYYDPACVDGPDAPGCVPELALEPPYRPRIPNPSWTAEAFMDTMLVNGAAYPKVTLEPKSYRLRILNAAHDRFLNLSLYEATTTVKSCTMTNAGSKYQVGDFFAFTGGHVVGKKYPQDAEGSVLAVDANGAITEFRIDNFGSHYETPPTGIVFDTADPLAAGATFDCTLQSGTEVAMVPAINYREYNRLNKPYLPVDYRDGGVPDPTTAGPSWVQIGSEGGFLPTPAVIPPFPVTFLLDPTQFNVGNVVEGSLRMGPAERADVIVDLSAYAGKTLILYNDAPAAYPAAVSNNDYYTGAPDLRDSGGHSGPQPGFSPNTRTIMQITVAGTADPAFSLPALQDQFKASAPGGGVFQRSQEPIIVGQTAYNSTYFPTGSITSFPAVPPYWGYSEIGDSVLNYEMADGVTRVSTPMEHKAIHDEMGGVYDEWGRMSAKLGVEVPVTSNLNQTFIMQNYVDPPTEIVTDGQVQIWKITHNGVDTHPMHFHLFDVQVINRVGWDGFKRLPDANEIGWKETVRISPLEDTIVALKPRMPKLPFGLPNSVRKLAPGAPDVTSQPFTNLETNGPNVGQAKAILDNNQVFDFGDEFVWHCHILSHEEQDMMRPISFLVTKIAPNAPSLTASFAGGQVTLSWIDPTPITGPFNPAAPGNYGNPRNEIGFRIERSENGGPYAVIGSVVANKTASTDGAVAVGSSYNYRVVAFNAAGETASNVSTVALIPPTAPTNLSANAAVPNRITLAWSDAAGETSYRVESSTGGAGFVPVATVGADVTTYSDTTFTHSTLTTYRVVSVNDFGEGTSNTATLAVEDNGDSGFSSVGTWSISTGVTGYYGSNYTFGNAGGTRTSTWSYTIPAGGFYEISAIWTSGTNRASNAQYTIANNGTVIATLTRDQRTNGGTFNSLGSYGIAAGTLSITVSTATANNVVVADATQIKPVNFSVIDNVGPGFAMSGTWATATSPAGFVGTNFRTAPAATTASRYASWTFQVPVAGSYTLSANWPSSNSFASQASYRIENNGVLLVPAVVRNQRINGGTYQSLGTYALNAGTVKVTLGNNANGTVAADAVKLSSP